MFGIAAAHRQHIDLLIETTRNAFFRFQLTGRLTVAVYQSLIILLIVGGLAGLYIAGTGELANLGAAVLLLVRAAAYGLQVQGGYHGLNQMLPYLDRLEAAAAGYRAAATTDGGLPLPAIVTLAPEDVGFAYRPGPPVLPHVSFPGPAAILSNPRALIPFS